MSVPPWMTLGTNWHADRAPELTPDHSVQYMARTGPTAEVRGLMVELLWRRNQAREHAGYWDGFEAFVAELGGRQ